MKHLANRREVQWNLPALISGAVLVVLVVVNASVQPGYFSSFNLTSVLTGALPLILIAAGQFFVILTGGIDLSVGAVATVANVVAAVMMKSGVASTVSITVLVVAIGLACGLLNGLGVVLGRIQPLLVTLATMSIFEGVALLVLPTPGGVVPTGFSTVLTGTTAAVVILIGLVAGWVWFQRTPLALQLMAVGSDEAAAQMNGMNVPFVKVAAYVLSGGFASLCGLYLAAQISSGDPTIGLPYTLLSIAAVVIGGARLAGGKGTLWGVVAGGFILSMLNSLIFFLGVSSYYKDLVQGLILLVAVAITTYRGVRLKYFTL